jgi:hypothetical protein
LHLKFQSAPRSKHSRSRLYVQATQLTLYSEIIAVCSEIHKKHINTLCGQNVEFFDVKLVVHIVTTVCSQILTKHKYTVWTERRICVLNVVVHIVTSESWKIHLVVKSLSLTSIQYKTQRFNNRTIVATWQESNSSVSVNDDVNC